MSANGIQYTLTENARPEKGRRVEWIAPDGRVVTGKFVGGQVWLLKDTDVYIYYTPLMWRYIGEPFDAEVRS